MDDYSVELDQETGLSCTLQLFNTVTNASEVRQELISGKLHCCMAKVSLVIDVLQAVVAANKAALNAKRNRLITKTVYTEVLFYLSMSKNISRSLAEFGVGDDDTSILVIVIHKPGEEQAVLQNISESIKGEKVPISKLSELADVNLIKKTYKIDENELRVSSLADTVVSRISCKEFILSN
ncbi:hypothetical protein PUN28_015202 [Cardiocondyla obscurior]|uniref:Uncharacterized protein n=1 Tax=Cardiocondyla obscurior TaxID=286306 RepID=A0AAW2EXJ7_9HYME